MTGVCNYCSAETVDLWTTPFMADRGALMCELCWTATRDEGRHTEEIDIGPWPPEEEQ